jgi:hypothetical protein
MGVLEINVNTCTSTPPRNKIRKEEASNRNTNAADSFCFELSRQTHFSIVF